MATQQSKRSREEEEGTTDEQGRKHDSRGRFTSEDEGDGNGARQGSSQGRGRSGGGSTNQGAKRVISRAIRVLDEIESRISELRQELEEQQGGGGRSGREEKEEERGDGQQGRGFAAMDPEERREVARKGGRAAHEQGAAHEWDEDEAREAGRASRNR
jgi:general stress protein YciG